LQLEVIRRALRLWTNPGDTVLSPFAGIGSEGYVALQEGRKFIGAELKDSYYRQMTANLAAASGVAAPTELIDLASPAPAAPAAVACASPVMHDFGLCGCTP
jgi:hypothetical protein